MAESPDDPWQTLSADIFSGMRDWRTQHPRATFREIELELDTRLARLRAQMLTDSALASAATDWAAAPPADQPLCAPPVSSPSPPVDPIPAACAGPMISPSPSPASMAPAPSVGGGFSPLDEELALPPGHFTPLLHEWVVHLGTWVPFGQVPRLLACFAGVTLCRETVRRQTEAAGAALVAADEAAAPALAPPADPGPDSPHRLQVSADGAMVRLQRGDWVEVKTVAVVPVPPPGAGRPAAPLRSYFSRHAPAEEFTRQAVVELHRRGVRCAAAVAGVADGAVWIQRFLDYHRPDAVRILDLPHVVEHLGRLAGAVWGEGSPTAQAWQREQAGQLQAQGPGPLWETLAELTAAHPANAALAEQVGYLERRAAQLAYPEFAAAGWPVGSGLVESANKVVVEARLKGAGMGGGVGALNPLLALRTAGCNDRWGEAWGVITQRQAGDQRARRGRGETATPGGPPGGAPEQATGGRRVPPAGGAGGGGIVDQVWAEREQARTRAAVVNGKPGPGHPWRHSPIGRARPDRAA